MNTRKEMTMLSPCDSTPVSFHALERVLFNPDVSAGIHHRVMVRGFDGPRDPARIRTLRVKTDANGLVDLHVESGTYRFMVFGDGPARIEVQALAGATINCTQNVQLELIVDRGRRATVEMRSNSSVTVTPSEGAQGTVILKENAQATIVDTGTTHTIRIHRPTET